jgi:hypothetical protein
MVNECSLSVCGLRAQACGDAGREADKRPSSSVDYWRLMESSLASLKQSLFGRTPAKWFQEPQQGG